MSSTPFGALVVVAAGALLALDHAAWPSLLLAQPLVAGWLCGAWLGHTEAGLAAGAVVQMLYLGVLPVGGSTPAEAWLGGLAAALCVPPDVTLGGTAWLDDPRLAAPAIVGIGAAYAGRALLLGQRALQARLAASAHAGLLAGDARGASRAVRWGLALHAGRGALGAALALATAPALAGVLIRCGCGAPAGRIALALAAVTLGSFGRRRGRPWLLLAGAGLGGLVAWL